MAVDSIIAATSAISAYNTQAQGSDAQKPPVASPVRKEGSDAPRFSVLGQVKATLEDVQAKADALKSADNPRDFTGFKAAVQDFVQSVNTLNRSATESSARLAARQEVRIDAARGEQQRAAQTAGELRQAQQTAADALQQLRSFGIEQQRDGTAAINEARLQNRFETDAASTLNAFNAVADRVGKAIDNQLSSIGSGSSQPNALSSNAPAVTSDAERSSAQARLEAQKAFQQRLASQLAGAGSYAARNAVVSYLNISDF